MKNQLLIFIGLLNVISSDGRLIQKNKTKTVEDAHTEKPNPTIRLTRDIEDDSLTGFANEEEQSEEFVSSYINRAKHFKTKIDTPKLHALKKHRYVRDSKENIKPVSKSKKTKVIAKPKEVLVKKPIPKFNYLEYDDFQSKMSNTHVIADSGEHEDEDFNLDDYDFDVNHDEFTSGRKHLEPRISMKTTISDNKNPNLKVQSKLLQRTTPKPVSIKKERSAELYSKKSVDKSKEIDYYDDITTTKAPETKPQDEDYSGENDESKEPETKNSQRIPRSWNVNLLADKFNNRGSRAMTKLLGVLPLFPQLPWAYYEINGGNSEEDI